MQRDLDDTRGGNGHSDPLADADTLKLEPLEWPEKRRRGLLGRLMSTRPMRAVASENAARPAPLTIGALISIAIFLVGQLVAAVYWGGRMSATVEQHEKTLSTAGISGLIASNDRLKDQLADLTAKYNRQQEYIDVITLYEQKIRELMVSTGRFRGSDLPPPPQRPRE
jgi:hypothetical protein